jgi:predicted GNAT family acetyltransferase
MEPDKSYARSKKTPSVLYALHEVTSLASGVRPDDPLTLAGYMEFLLDEHTREANVHYSEIESEYRGKGLGLLLYKTAINDLVESGYEVVSDYVRSKDAERVWQSIRRDNPDEVYVVSRDPSYRDESFPSGVYEVRPAYYTVGEFIGRRPVRVRNHRRRSPR